MDELCTCTLQCTRTHGPLKGGAVHIHIVKCTAYKNGPLYAIYKCPVVTQFTVEQRITTERACNYFAILKNIWKTCRVDHNKQVFLNVAFINSGLKLFLSSI